MRLRGDGSETGDWKLLEEDPGGKQQVDADSRVREDREHDEDRDDRDHQAAVAFRRDDRGGVSAGERDRGGDERTTSRARCVPVAGAGDAAGGFDADAHRGIRRANCARIIAPARSAATSGRARPRPARAPIPMHRSAKSNASAV